jgi:GntR family transcriptional regulator/MocR family aminotransferase
MLAAETGLSRNTILAAFDQLQAEGYIEARRGAGTFVAPLPPEHFLTAPTANTARVPCASAGALSARGEHIARVRRLPLPSVLGHTPRRSAFLVGLPALDVFPIDTWTKLYTDCLRKSGTQLLCYGDPAGYRPLRESVATYISTARGIRCTAEQVIITTGSQQALELCARILLDPGDAAWVEDPGYLGARAAFVSAGARLIPVPVDTSGLDVEAGIRAERYARLAFVTPSHQFPLGHVMSLERRLALIDWAANNNSWIIEDDYDAEFRYVGKPHAALAAIDRHERVIYVGTFSKALFPGLRLGYLIAPASLVDGFRAAHLSVDMHATLIEQAVVAAFADGGHLVRHLRRLRILHQERQEALINIAAPLHDKLTLSRPGGGLHLLGVLEPGRDDRAIARNALRHDVHLWPLSPSYLGSNQQNGLLLGYAATGLDDMIYGVNVLEQLLGSPA